LQLLNDQSTKGSALCHITVDRTGKNVLVASYGGGSVAVLPIGNDGRLGSVSSFVQHHDSSIDPQRQRKPHAHSINLDVANRFAFVPDLGLDKVMIYRFDPAAGTLEPNDPPSASVAPGSGPRHFAFHPDGRHAYVINETASTVTGFDYDPADGTLGEFQTLSTLPAPTPGNSTAEVQVHPSGKFLYGSNRGHNSIAIFTIDPASGKLTPVGYQGAGIKVPRNFGIDPTGTYLIVANLEGNSLIVFRIDQQSGQLTPTGSSIAVSKPACVKFTKTD
jgi:6-phosphogluconolactonase